MNRTGRVVLIVSACASASAHSTEFSLPQYLNPTAAGESAHDTVSDMCVSATGTWIVVWYALDAGTDEPLFGREILFSRSLDAGVTWSTPAFVDAEALLEPGNNFDPKLATDDAGNWVIVWRSSENFFGNGDLNDDVVVARSSDDGATWSMPALLYPSESDTAEDRAPTIGTDKSGLWIAVWSRTDPIGGNDDIIIARSTDNGATWSTPALLHNYFATDTGGDSGPGLTTDGNGNWIVVWASSGSFSGTLGSGFDVLFSRSTDNGNSWTTPAPLDADAINSRGTHPRVVTDQTGNWLVVWRISGINFAHPLGTDGDIACARSSDNGATWSAAAIVNSNATTDSETDFEPNATTDASGTWSIVWNTNENVGGTIGTDPDILTARSTDGGVSWTTLAPLVALAATDSGIDSVPAIATDGLGTWITAWSSDENLGGVAGFDKDVFVARSVDASQTWSGPNLLHIPPVSDLDRDLRAEVATDDSGHWLAVWTVGGEEAPGSVTTSLDIRTMQSADAGATWTPASIPDPGGLEPVGSGSLARMATDGSGTWIAVWSRAGNPTGSDSDVYFSRSTDNGATWTTAAALNSNAATDLNSTDILPTIAYNGLGSWIVSWSTSGDLSPEWDIVTSRSTNGGLSWSAPALLQVGATSDDLADWKCELESDGTGITLALLVRYGELGGFHQYNYALYLAQSNDGGTTWSTPQFIEFFGGSYLPDLYAPRMATDQAGNWIIAFDGDIDPIDGTARSTFRCYFVRSTDNGQTWSRAKRFAQMEPGMGYGEQAPDIATSGTGEWLVAWSTNALSGETPGNNFDIAYVKSFNDGVSWSSPLRLNPDMGMLADGRDGPVTLASSAYGEFVAAYVRGLAVNGAKDDDLLVTTGSIVPGASTADRWALSVAAVVLLAIGYLVLSARFRNRRNSPM